MTDLCRKNIRIWLRNAHAMEEEAEQLFSGQLSQLEDYVSSYQKMELEINYIKKHQILLSIRLQQLGSAPSIIKDASAKVVAETKNLSGTLMKDGPVDGILALHTFTQTTIGLYKILIAAAETVNDSETKKVCNDILEHTETRAVWIVDELTGITKNFLSKLP